MSSRAPASLRTSGLFSSVKQADDKEETSALAAAAAAASASAAAAASPEGGAARLGSGTCSPPCPPRPVSPRPNAAARNAALVRLHAAACHRSWAELPGESSFGGEGSFFSASALPLSLDLLSPSLSPLENSSRSLARSLTNPAPIELARDALAAGCGQPELRATLRHLVICAGYAGSLAATSALSEAKVRKSFFSRRPKVGARFPGLFFTLALFLFLSPKKTVLQLLGPATPGKVGGPPSDAFGLMYGREGSELVAKRLHRLDPVLARR